MTGSPLRADLTNKYIKYPKRRNLDRLVYTIMQWCRKEVIRVHSRVSPPLELSPAPASTPSAEVVPGAPFPALLGS